MRYIFLLFLTVVAVNAQNLPTLQKYNGLFMPVSEATPDLYYFLIRGETYGETAKDRVKLDDDDFSQAVKEVGDKKIHQLVARKAALTHNSIDSFKRHKQLKFLDLSNNRLITDMACKKIGENFPRLERLNLYNTSITDKGLEYLLNLTSLRTLHVGGTNVTFDGANKFRGLMESTSANDDLEITIGWGEPSLASFKKSAILKATYQKNVDAGKLNANFKVDINDSEK
tara:strand:- start:145 stop:828 length:684 start_codon:yes stop_codon:yes gene_type:complete